MRSSCRCWGCGWNSQYGEAFVSIRWTLWSSTSSPRYRPNSAHIYAHPKTHSPTLVELLSAVPHLEPSRGSSVMGDGWSLSLMVETMRMNEFQLHDSAQTNFADVLNGEGHSQGNTHTILFVKEQAKLRWVFESRRVAALEAAGSLAGGRRGTVGGRSRCRVLFHGLCADHTRGFTLQKCIRLHD